MNIDKDISIQLSKSLTETQIHLIKPNKNDLVSVLKLKAEDISALPESKLTQYIYTLSQYSVFLHVQANSRKIFHNEAKRGYEFEVTKRVATVSGKTIKERTAQVLQSDEELQLLEKEARKAEADHILFDNIPESVAEIANALKKELSFRFNNKKYA